MIEVLTNGPANCLHDAGRFGLLHLGVSRSGAMDRLAYDTAHALLGNAGDEAVIEVAMFPFRLHILADTRLALTGADCIADLDGQALPPNWTINAPAGSVLTLTAPRIGLRAYVAFAGGIAVAPVLGSRSTDLKAGFGGHQGRGLQKGDRLPLATAGPAQLPPGGWGALPDAASVDFWTAGADRATLRFLPAAEYDAFTPEAQALLTGADWRVTHESNRLGYRLEGPQLALKSPLELFSHGLLPGTIQVPASGQPIIQSADANTCGGYPKFGVVITPDLWKLAQLGPDATLRFVASTGPEALDAHQAQQDWLANLAAQSKRMTGSP